MLIDIDIDDHLVLLAQVRHLHNLAGGLAEALVSIVFLDQQFDAVGDIGRHLAARLETQALDDVLLLTALHAIIVHLRDTRLLAQVKHQPSLILIDLLNKDLYLREQALTPEALGGSLEVITRYIDMLAHSQA